jgi:hypothetical protein
MAFRPLPCLEGNGSGGNAVHPEDVIFQLLAAGIAVG